MNTKRFDIETTNHAEPSEINRLTGVTGAPALSNLRWFTAAYLSKLNELKERVLQALAAEYGASLSASLIQQAVQEADSLASATPFPSLVLPVLAEEKVRSASAWNSRQAAIHHQTRVFAA